MLIGGRSSSKRTGRKSSSMLIGARPSELREELVNVHSAGARLSELKEELFKVNSWISGAVALVAFKPGGNVV